MNVLDAVGCAVVVALSIAVLPAQAQMPGHAHGAAAAAPVADYADGEVRKVDKAARKLTLRHGPIANLGMSSMTMMFGVKDAAVLDRVKSGDMVRFKAEQVGGQLVVTELVLAK